MTTPTERVRLGRGKGLSRCLSSQSLHGETLWLWNLDSQDKHPQIPGSSGQHWVFVVYWAPEVESSRCRADAATVCPCAYHSHDEVSCIPRSVTAPTGMGHAFLEEP